MSIVLKDGTVLPDLPEGVITEEYPYAYIAQSGQIAMDGTDIVFLPHEGRYIIRASKYKAGYVSPELAELPFGVFMNISTTEENTGHAFIYDMADADSGWVSVEANSILPYGVEGYIGWSNHDVCVVSGFDEATGDMIYGEIYFPSSVKPPFVLPDGTELPALPDGCFDGTPYGVVVTGNDLVSLVTASSPTIYSAEVPICVTNQSGILSMWDCVDGSWTPYANNVEVPSGAFGADLEGALWSNHDIMNATSSDDGSYTIGTEIARKSDVNYRVTDGWMRLIANEARRFGNTADGLTSDDMETILRAVELSGSSEIEYPNAMEVSF